RADAGMVRGVVAPVGRGRARVAGPARSRRVALPAPGPAPVGLRARGDRRPLRGAFLRAASVLLSLAACRRGRGRGAGGDRRGRDRGDRAPLRGRSTLIAWPLEVDLDTGPGRP